MGQVAENVERQRGPRILVVEDDPAVRTLISRALVPDYQIETAVDGAEGVEKALAMSPELIVTDLRMPRVSGGELVREVRTHADLDTTSILVVSGQDDAELRIHSPRRSRASPPRCTTAATSQRGSAFGSTRCGHRSLC